MCAAGLLALAAGAAAAPADTCSPQVKTDCGFSVQAACERQGCCWSEKGAPSDPFCFYPHGAPTPAPDTPAPPTPAPGCAAPATRSNCGYSGIDQTGCEKKGCCWDPVDPDPRGLPWCYHRAGCGPTDKKTACGFVGIDRPSCEGRGCCWEEVNPNPGNIPWCFLSHNGTAPTPEPAPAPGATPAPTPAPSSHHTPAPATPAPSKTCDIPDSARSDCGKVGTKQGDCEAAGCCWKPIDPNPSNLPWCYYTALPPAPTPPPTPFPPLPPGTGPFSADELTTMAGFFFKNIDIQGSGMTCAAPTGSQHGGGSYYYHWMRDGGMVMRSLLNNFPWAQVNTKLQHYVQHVLKVQVESDPNGIDVRGEPKFLIPSGTPFTGGWCRPQYDGAGIRGGTLALYALALIQKGQTDYVKQYLWTGGAYNGGAIKYDLDFATSVWNRNGCDLWEEVQSDGFYWNMAQTRYGLLAGAQVAEKMGDSSTAAHYRSVAGTIASAMKSHTASGVGGNFIYESSNRQKDVAALLGVLHDDPSNPVYAPSSAEVANTVATLDQVFTQMFPINSNGPKLYGRYQGDKYAGGNPWVLACCGKAQALWRAAGELARGGALASGEGEAAWRRYAGAAGLLGAAANSTRAELAQALADSGDAVMSRVRDLVKPLGFHLPEQLDKGSGAMANVPDLTWSYAALFDALAHRGKYTAALSAGSAR